MLLAAVATFVVIAGIGFVLGGFWRWYMILVALPAAALAAVVVMNRRGNNAMYNALDGQPGASGAALMGMGKRGWFTSQEPVAVDAMRGTKVTDMTGAAMVFRALRAPGIILIGEGPAGRVQKLLKAEEKKVSRVAPGVPVHLWVAGEGEDMVSVRKLGSKDDPDASSAHQGRGLGRQQAPQVAPECAVSDPRRRGSPPRCG